MITAERIKEGIMSLKNIPTARLLIEYRAAGGELKNLMAMEIEGRWADQQYAMMKQREAK